jgi:CRISPR-associated protein Cmr4
MTLLAETSLHPGVGQSVGSIDLPIQRERHTGFPVLYASSLKGSLRHAAAECHGNHSDIVTAIFGPPEKPEHAGALQVFDAHLLALPVRALQQVFVWVTCPLLLARLKRDIALANLSSPLCIPDIAVPQGYALVATGSDLTGELVLEDLTFNLGQGTISDDLEQSLTKRAPQEIGADWSKRLAVISDDDFRYLAMYTTPASARVKLTAGKTTGKWSNPITNNEDQGNLWYVETLPPETLLYAVLTGMKPKTPAKNGKAVLSDAADVLKKMTGIFTQGRGSYVQVGGNETVGEGWCRIAFFGDQS